MNRPTGSYVDPNPDYFRRVFEPAPGTALAMSLREHYAGLAMAAVLASADKSFANCDPDEIAIIATDNADALIAKLAEKPEAPK